MRKKNYIFGLFRQLAVLIISCGLTLSCGLVTYPEICVSNLSLSRSSAKADSFVILSCNLIQDYDFSRDKLYANGTPISSENLNLTSKGLSFKVPTTVDSTILPIKIEFELENGKHLSEPDECRTGTIDLFINIGVANISPSSVRCQDTITVTGSSFELRTENEYYAYFWGNSNNRVSISEIIDDNTMKIVVPERSLSSDPNRIEIWDAQKGISIYSGNLEYESLDIKIEEDLIASIGETIIIRGNFKSSDTPSEFNVTFFDEVKQAASEVLDGMLKVVVPQKPRNASGISRLKVRREVCEQDTTNRHFIYQYKIEERIIAGTTDESGCALICESQIPISGMEAQFRRPVGIIGHDAGDGNPNIYVADQDAQVIQKLIPQDKWTYDVKILAGSCNKSGGHESILDGCFARLWQPTYLAIDQNNFLYVTESLSGLGENLTIRRINLVNQKVERFSGIFGSSVETRDSGDRLDVSYNSPDGIAIDNKGNVFISDQFQVKILKINTAGTVTIHIDGLNNNMIELKVPMGMAVDRNNNIYLADDSNFSNALWRFDSKGNISNIIPVNNTAERDNTDKIVNLSDAKFNAISDVAVDSKGSLYLTDRLNGKVKMIEYSKGAQKAIVRTLLEGLDKPQGIYVFEPQNSDEICVFITDTGNKIIRKLILY